MPRGYGEQADVPITNTRDGVDLNDVWAQFQAVLNEANRSRGRLLNFLTFTVSNPVETISLTGSGEAAFEVASEYGEPVAYRKAAQFAQMGYGFEWYDTARRYTWRHLAEVDARSLAQDHNNIVDADQRLQFKKVMERIFNPDTEIASISGNNHNVYALYSGTRNVDENDPSTAPPVPATGFGGEVNHDHYATTGDGDPGSGALDTAAFEALVANVEEHGYGRRQGGQILVLANDADIATIEQFRASDGSTEDEANPLRGRYSFIPNRNSDLGPVFLEPEQVVINNSTVGLNPPTNYRGLEVVGSYGSALVVREDQIPVGYLLAVSVGGSDNDRNLVGVREHERADLRGLRLMPGNYNAYPLIDSFYLRGFGTGIRHRGAAAVLQITDSATYSMPDEFVGVANNGI